MRKIVAFAILAGLLFAHSQVASKVNQLEKTAYSPLESPPLVELDEEIIFFSTLGNISLYHTFLNVWAIGLLLDEKIQPSDADGLINVLMAIAKHEIEIESFYTWSCLALYLRFNRPDACEPITHIGLRALPNSRYIATVQGYIFALVLNDPVSALPYYSLAASRPDAPPMLKNLVNKFMNSEQVSPSELIKSMETVIGTQNIDMAKFLEDIARIKRSQSNAQENQ